jgi:protein translocase SecG subunit
MSLLIGFLTFVLMVNCLFLILLVLIQLPKKEAGAGIAFGGGATDALFGAGSGNALTKLTKYAATGFLGLAILLFVLNLQQRNRSSKILDLELSKQAGKSANVVPPPATTATTPANQISALKPVAPPSNPLSVTLPAATNLEAPLLNATMTATNVGRPVQAVRGELRTNSAATTNKAPAPAK